MKIRTLFFILILIAGGYIAYKIYHKPYDITIDISEIPTFREVDIRFNHQHSKERSLPFTGAAAFDVDGDHTPEVFIGGGYAQKDGLFKYKEGEFIDISHDSGITKALQDTTHGAATIDANNDGQTDIFIARNSGIYLYTNQNGFFTEKKLNIKFNEKSIPLSIALTDLNRDGYIDMFLSNYIKPSMVEGQSIFNNTNYGASSIMLLNNGDNTFSDITKKAGLDFTHNTFTAIFADIDNDSWADLIVAFDTGHIKTYKNQGNSTFIDIPNPSTTTYSYPMGIAVGDYNNDGRIDFFFSNVGTTIPLFLARGDLKDNQILNPKWILLRNEGKFTFTDTANEAKVANYEFGWGAIFEDFNMDGRQDLAVSTNYINFPPHQIYKSPGKLLVQKDGGIFVPVEKQAGVENRHYGITPLTGDFNDDGYPDLIQINLNGPTKAFINNGGNSNYCKLILEDKPSSLGAIITLETNSGNIYTQQMISGEGLSSDQSHAITFGLAYETGIVKIEIKYPSGKIITIERPEINNTIIVNSTNFNNESETNIPPTNETLPLDGQSQLNNSNLDAPIETEALDATLDTLPTLEQGSEQVLPDATPEPILEETPATDTPLN